MKEVNLEVLKDAANRLMFDMTDEQYQTLLNEFAVLKKQMEKIGEVKGIEDAIPMTFPFDVTTDVLRDDVASTPLPREEALKNAGSKFDGQIKLPKVVG